MTNLSYPVRRGCLYVASALIVFAAIVAVVLMVPVWLVTAMTDEAHS